MSKRIGEIRNIGIIAHIDAGKTTTSERFLYYSGATHRIGNVDDGSTVLDYLEQERERGITITSAAATIPWRDYQINLVDTPGHVDFTVEVERALRAIDGAVTVLCGVGGVEPQTENVWSRAHRHKLPSIIFVNKMDRMGADFRRAVSMVHDRLGMKTLILQIPVGSGNDFRGIIDLINMKYLTWNMDTRGATFETETIPSDLRDQANEARQELLENIADIDDSFLEHMLEVDDPDLDLIRSSIRRITCTADAVPVYCGAALRDIGIQPLLDAVIDFLPSPVEAKPIVAFDKETGAEIHFEAEEKAQFLALAFKVMYQETQSRLTYIRVYSGTLHPGDEVLNTTQDVVERPKRFYRMYADKRQKVDRLTAGDVSAVAGFGKAFTGDTLCSPSRPVLMAGDMDFPIPVVSSAVSPKTKKDEDKLEKALEKLSVEDPTFTVREDKETGQTVISGMGELHLQVLIQRLKVNFQVDARVGNPQVAYKETVEEEATVEATFEKQLAGRIHAATVTLSIAPAAQRAGILYRESVSTRSLPSDLREAARQTVDASVSSGVLMGYPMVDLAISFDALAYSDDTISPLAVAGAMSKAFHEACQKAKPILLEPQVLVEISVPAENLGAVVDSINSRGGRVSDIDTRPMGHGVKAIAPMSKMFGYATEMRSLTQGRATLFMKFSHFAPVSG